MVLMMVTKTMTFWDLMGSSLKSQIQASVQMATVSSGECQTLTPYSADTGELLPWQHLSTDPVTVTEQSYVTSLVMSALVVLQTKVSQ